MENKYKELVEALEEQVIYWKNGLLQYYHAVEGTPLVEDSRQELLLRVKIEQLKKQLWT